MMIVPLDPDQELAAEAIHGNVVVVAGPGAGKTTVLTNRYVRMISKHGIKREDILNLTFTAEAAKHMVERVGLFDAKEVFRTFHSFALDLVMRERAHLPFPINDFVLPQHGQDFALLKSLMKVYPSIEKFRKLKDTIAGWKASNVSPEEAIRDSYGDPRGTDFWLACAYRDYEKRCREEGWLDFDSLMRETVKLLETNEEVRARWTRKYICVDECQDTDVTQFRLLQLIYGGNIFVVGDENQLIYEWRSAVAGNLTNFSQHFPGSRTLFLGANYRSTGAIVDFLKKILPVDNGLATHMRSMRHYGEKPDIIKYESDFHEEEGVLANITWLNDVNNTAVIARTNRQLRQFQRAAASKGMRTMILGQKDLWQTTEVKHLVELVKEKDENLPAFETLTRVMAASDLPYIYRSTGGPNEKPPVENLNDFIKLAAKRGTVKEFLNWLRKLTFACEAAKSPTYAHREKHPTLALTTVHQAKGREWKNVFVIGARQGSMPHKDGDFLEEKRIFFVACSRAADLLHVSYDGNRSEFLAPFASSAVEI
jgi:DNA helicase II / ATP-dependent DNA helicase PcrA